MDLDVGYSWSIALRKGKFGEHQGCQGKWHDFSSKLVKKLAAMHGLFLVKN
jgi:hypothetical protein